MTAVLDRSERTPVADPVQPRLFRVLKSIRETSDTFTVDLAPQDRAAAFPFLPGQFNMLYAPNVGECAVSISGDPARPEVLQHTTRMVGSVTRALYHLKPGDTLGVRGPYGTAWPMPEARGSDVVFVAGGIGLAPLRPAMLQVLSHRADYGRVILLYGARTPDDILYRRELERWRKNLDLEVYVTVDRAESGWRGNVGVVPALIRRAPFDRLNSVAFVCGPEVMMHYTVLELTGRGIEEQRIHLSLERNMKCAVGQCGHCQFGPYFVCKDGPVFRYDRVRPWLEHREL